MSYVVTVCHTPAGHPFGNLKFQGSIGVEELIGSFSELAKCEAFFPEISTIWDFSEASLPLSYGEIQNVAAHFVENAPERQGTPYCAFITDNSSDISVLETYIPAAARYPVIFNIVPRRKEAIDWLDSHQ